MALKEASNPGNLGVGVGDGRSIILKGVGAPVSPAGRECWLFLGKSL